MSAGKRHEAAAGAVAAPASAGAVRIGISGWRYPPWRSVFYPPGLVQADELHYASRQLRTIEINGSFYSLQRPASYQAWHDATPDDFVFAVKGGRFITHNKRLKGGVKPLANFFASGVLALKGKLGPFLWQLPPQLRFEPAAVADFLALLPRTTTEAAALARRHDQRLKHRAFLQADAERPLRHVFEVRHESFIDPAFIRLLRQAGVALCVADSAGHWPLLEDLTADFVYVRLHGATQLYASGYSPRALDHWAQRVRTWRAGGQAADATVATQQAPAPLPARDVYVYFDNDAKIRAPYDALNLVARIEGSARVAFPRSGARVRGEEPRTHWPAWEGLPRRAGGAS